MMHEDNARGPVFRSITVVLEYSVLITPSSSTLYHNEEQRLCRTYRADLQVVIPYSMRTSETNHGFGTI